jgi:hypothetical protein
LRIAQHHFRLLGHDRHHPRGSFEACLAVEALGRWVRAGLFYGEAPGSNMMGKHAAVWHTHTGGPGAVHGWNLRFGWWPRPCVTMLLHTRKARP